MWTNNRLILFSWRPPGVMLKETRAFDYSLHLNMISSTVFWSVFLTSWNSFHQSIRSHKSDQTRNIYLLSVELSRCFTSRSIIALNADLDRLSPSEVPVPSLIWLQYNYIFICIRIKFFYMILMLIKYIMIFIKDFLEVLLLSFPNILQSINIVFIVIMNLLSWWRKSMTS